MNNLCDSAAEWCKRAGTPAQRRLREWAVGRAITTLWGLGKTESPIEELLFVALLCVAYEACEFWGVCKHNETAVETDVDVFGEGTSKTTGLVLKVVPQFPVGKYRLDFLVSAYEGEGDQRTFAVECDGHATHSSRQQRTHDAERDRAVAVEGIETIRFTGTEIHADAFSCAEQIIAIARARLAGRGEAA